MPFVTSRGNRIHYTVEGTGPLVVLLHGLLSDARSWKRWGVIETLADGYCVASVDSLGHGLSDKPSDHNHYGLEVRAADVLAVIDDLGCEKAHLIGYSMGGWLSVGVARHHRDRLSSLVIGGWDIVHGIEAARPQGMRGVSDFRDQIADLRVTAPAVVKWVTAEVEPGLCACWEALADVCDARDAVVQAGVPVLLWSGREDLNYEPMKAFAAAERTRFLVTGGDHGGAIWQFGRESGAGIRRFLDTQRTT
ncbi:MAG TPA: alpha/beta fold hydrolase [Phenylobacterium sp.]|uniref:alpha/beta fold hydrolase n=1 Tax=Phenylobacterium sp. TaxID=1871053 RepID=UPI002C607944|nr:alpha/beta fold hydrolase [Phenylobacterium sp.]HSV04103.1 alpha/beta fold hydrolase [Phenylobacterium sp.]